MGGEKSQIMAPESNEMHIFMHAKYLEKELMENRWSFTPIFMVIAVFSKKLTIKMLKVRAVCNYFSCHP